LSSDEPRPKFIVDANVGKLARWLRMLGYDTMFVNDIDDGVLVDIGLKEERVLLTKDTQIMLRRAVTSGKVKALLTSEDDPKKQMRRVITEMKLDREREFTLCLECNVPLIPRSKDEVRDLVPPYVYKTQTQYHQCPACGRIYWRGTHWENMKQVLGILMEAEV
jgi:uncharacterized protein with PIN domain